MAGPLRELSQHDGQRIAGWQCVFSQLCLPCRGGAREVLNTAEDGESEGKAAGPPDASANRHVET